MNSWSGVGVTIEYEEGGKFILLSASAAVGDPSAIGTLENSEYYLHR
jgi:hypothetical protein